MTQTIPMRKGEELDVVKLEYFLRNHIDHLLNDPLMAEQFATGASNLTNSLKIGEWEDERHRGH
ncbi:hypothetical protein [Aeribacillus alveayuensis]|uniref:Aminoglycoside phosphotransferase (APT) family kinase protein n=1 Tax=Aeribacillus alveayuensis TaxID=279215 RepID=A0ABT9VMM1_9BACI|nr:aminoglycoside phosphotransferase (APT) family kinase protein [Bacillus alveayuensis]